MDYDFGRAQNTIPFFSMIKELKRFQIRTTPFQATKNWQLNNIFNNDVILFEQTASDGSDIAMALEFIDYGDGSSLPITGSLCDVSLEQQDADRVSYREGLKLSGPFYLDLDPKNFDGTYKRSVYSQINTSFYNTFRNPTEILGVENIDFELSKTKRRITDKVKLFDVPRIVFGDKIIPGSVRLFDFSQDNEYVISDDGFENLNIGSNIFSKFQEIGSFGNSFLEGSSSVCNDYFNLNTGSSSSSLVVCSFDSGLTASSYAISGYFDGMISGSNGFTPPFSTDVIWDGVFRLHFVNSSSNDYFFYGFDQFTNFPTASVINDHEMCNEYLFFRCSASVPVWNFYIISNFALIVYSAVKIGSNSPVGVYTNDSGSSLSEIFFTADSSSIDLTPVSISIVVNSTPQTSSVLQTACGTV